MIEMEGSCLYMKWEIMEVLGSHLPRVWEQGLKPVTNVGMWKD